MRRSAAPSSQSAAKRLRFLSPFLNSSIELEENDIFNTPKIKCDTTVHVPVPEKLQDAVSNVCESNASSSVRNTDEILKFLLEPTTEDNTNNDHKGDLIIPTPVQENVGVATKSLPVFRRKAVFKDDKCKEKECTSNQDAESVNSDPNVRFYSVLWCKRSAKKHKVWEGDGTLIVKSRSAILKDASGKVIDRGMGYKLKEIEDIEDGGKFFIGGKECEIQSEMSPEEYKKLENSESPTSDASVAPNISKNTNLLRKPPLRLQVSCEKRKICDTLSADIALPKPKLENEDVTSTTCDVDASRSVRSTDEILKLLFEPTEDSMCTDIEFDERIPATELEVAHNLHVSNVPLHAVQKTVNEKCEVKKFADHQDEDFSDFRPNIQYYNVLWCKRSAKKHKSWEGDGTLIIRNRSAVLKNASGKEIDRGLGYKLKEIEAIVDGGKFFIGGKECEIQFKIPPEEYKDLENEQPDYDVQLVAQNSSNCANLSKKYHPLKFQSPFQKEEIFSLPENILVLPQPTLEHQLLYNKENLPLVDVKVDSFLVKQLRSHQKEGIIFMYKCILGFQHEYGNGVILADEMGLGKTLQCIALIWTLYKQGPYGGKPILKRVIIITPSSLVTNWKKEFSKWLGESRLCVFPVDKKHNVKDFMKVPKAVLIISYEKFLRSSDLLSAIPFDLVVCDEGHRIKNLNIKISNVVNCLSTSRRILLTGTPVQNDLAEYFSIVDFVNPGALGSMKSFRRSFEKPILQSRDQECSEEEREIGEERSQELNKISSLFMLRRTQEVINQYLPSKSEVVVFCRPSEIQKTLYKMLLNTGSLWKLLTGGVSVDSSQHLIYISILRKLCNHPALLYEGDKSEDNYILSSIQSAFPDLYTPSPCDSGKMKVLEKILMSIFSQAKKEKVVIVSGFTQTLDLIEKLCKSKGYQFLRLDGSTATSSRQDLVDVFNRSYTKYNIFLLSSKAGGVGFNLIGASRILLYDIDWNPANDLQAMARIWRDGQKLPVYVYRLLTTGTIEEKIYQRQILKQCLSGSVLNKNSSEQLKFSHEELKDLFTLHEDTQCSTHDLINCKCLSEKENIKDNMENRMESNPGSENIGMEELLNWKHVCGPISKENTSDFALTSSGSDITFLLVNNVNSAN